MPNLTRSNKAMITSSYLKRPQLPIQTTDKENEERLEEKRLNDLKARFNNLGLTVEKTKRTRYETIEDQMSVIDNSLTNLLAEKTLTDAKSEIGNLKIKCEESNLDIDEIDAQFQKKLSVIVENFREGVDDLRSDNRGLLCEFSKQSSDRLFALRLALSKNQKTFQDHLDSFSLKVSEDIDAMRDGIEKEAEERDQSAQGIESAILGELDKLEEEILVDRKVKEQTSGRIKLLIEELNNDIYGRIESEKKEREMSNNSLLNLLEEACNRIERNFAGF